MSGMSGSSQGLGGKLATQPVARPAAPDRLTRWLIWSAAAGIISALVLMIAASAVRNSWEHPYIQLPSDGLPPWALTVHTSLLPAVTVAMWAAALLGAGGVAAGLAALSRGGMLPVRLLLAAGLAAVALFTVLPPTGSTDALDYAAYGRMVVIGRSPYVMTPNQLRRLGDPVGQAIPRQWR